MILCITPNPAIDRTILLPRLILGEVHRAKKVIVAAGGKGLNVARAIRILGGEVRCLGFAGGYAGHLLADLAQNEDLDGSWTWTNSETRTCTILISEEGHATEIDEPGLAVSHSDWKALQQEVNKHISSAHLVCISGSLPAGSAADDLQELLNAPLHSGRQVWVDTSGAALHRVLNVPKLCVKVNGHEIGEALGFDVNNLDSAQRALLQLDEHDLTAALITLGSVGAVLATKEGRWQTQGPRVPVVSAVGSGDAFLAGLVSALDAGKAWPQALVDAVAAGTANTLLAGGGNFKFHQFEEIREQVEIETW
jgi:1-phosphofructokinase family hexose kinase